MTVFGASNTLAWIYSAPSIMNNLFYFLTMFFIIHYKKRWRVEIVNINEWPSEIWQCDWIFSIICRYVKHWHTNTIIKNPKFTCKTWNLYIKIKKIKVSNALVPLGLEKDLNLAYFANYRLSHTKDFNSCTPAEKSTV